MPANNSRDAVYAFYWRTVSRELVQGRGVPASCVLGRIDGQALRCQFFRTANIKLE